MKKLLSLLLGACTLFTACTNEDDGIFLPDNQLQLKFGVNNPTSRAIFTESTLPNNNPVGVKLDDGEETAYDKYTNITFTGYTDDKGQQVWTPSEAVVLGPTKATLYAYYPCTGAESMDAIPVDMTAEDQTDWLYATPVENVDEDNPSHAVTMNHALANINLTINRGSYVGDGNISSITVQSDAFATKGTFNAAQAEPAFTSFADTEGQPLTRTITATLGSTTDIMVVPTATEANIDFVINVDGVNYTAQAKPVQLVNGNSYLYTLTLNSTFLGISSFGVQPWVTQQKDDDLILEKDEYADWIKLVYNVEDVDEGTDLFYYYYWDEEDNGGIDLSLVDKMVVDGNEISPVTEYHFQSTGEHEVYVKFVDQTAIPKEAFRGCSEMTAVIIPKSVTSIGESVFENCEGLQSASIGEGVQTIGESAFFSCNKLTSIVVDPNNVIYDSRNNCNAIMETATNTLIVGCNNTVIPQDCQAIGNDAFYGCSGLTELTIPKSVTSIGEYAFALAGSGEGSEIIWPENASVIKKSTFWSCIFERVVIPEGVTVIEESAFNSSYYLKEITVPNSVTSIGDGAFECCWCLEKITFGTGVQRFETGIFGECEELMDIHFLSTTPPQVSADFLEDLWGMNRGVIYVPRGCIDNYADWVTPVEEQNWTIAEELFVINSADKSNGVYIITANGELVDKSTATTDAIGVALITDNQRIMIAKNDATDDGSNYNLYWGMNLNGKDVTSLQNSNYDYALVDFTGYENTQKIISFYTENEDEIKMDSKDMCKVVETLNKGKNSQSNEGYRDWYVPAAGQLYEIYTNRANINTALTNIGGTTLYTSGLYWSSSEKDADLGWRLDFSNGSVNGSSKVHNLYVRFVRDIN